MIQNSSTLLSLLGDQPVIPVLQIDDPERATHLVRALSRGGLRLVEITLRTPRALEAIQRVALEVEDAVVGAGTVLQPRQFDDALRSGARFAVSPGFISGLLTADAAREIPLLPGAATPSEVMAASDAGLSFLKFFPAEQSGGAAFLRSLASPFPEVSFCPTGGITESVAGAYLGLPNVACVGGSWIAPKALVDAGAWDEIEFLARRACLIRGRDRM